MSYSVAVQEFHIKNGTGDILPKQDEGAKYLSLTKRICRVSIQSVKRDVANALDLLPHRLDALLHGLVRDAYAIGAPRRTRLRASAVLVAVGRVAVLLLVLVAAGLPRVLEHPRHQLVVRRALAAAQEVEDVGAQRVRPAGLLQRVLQRRLDARDRVGREEGGGQLGRLRGRQGRGRVREGDGFGVGGGHGCLWGKGFLFFVCRWRYGRELVMITVFFPLALWSGVSRFEVCMLSVREQLRTCFKERAAGRRSKACIGNCNCGGK